MRITYAPVSRPGIRAVIEFQGFAQSSQSDTRRHWSVPPFRALCSPCHQRRPLIPNSGGPELTQLLTKEPSSNGANTPLDAVTGDTRPHRCTGIRRTSGLPALHSTGRTLHHHGRKAPPWSKGTTMAERHHATVTPRDSRNTRRPTPASSPITPLSSE